MEIIARKRFYLDHGRALAHWVTVPGLDDYPHTCVAKPRSFDDGLPDAAPGISISTTLYIYVCVHVCWKE